MLLGMATHNIQADDVPAAAQWYGEIFGVEPYFVRDGYSEFRIGRDQDEFGIVDRRFVPGSAGRTPGGQFVYWAVEDVASAIESLLARGASVYEPVTVRSEGWVTAAVVDPFGNVIGVMQNPHWAGADA